MGNRYSLGPNGVRGPYGHVHPVTYDHLWRRICSNIDLSALYHELSELHLELRLRSTKQEYHQPVREVALAEVAAKTGHGPNTLEHLAQAGKVTLQLAEDVGASVVAEVLREVLEF
jgi:hypothetical protein